ncbi:small nucleolar RNP protein Sm [Aeropyrum camini SY1 = JCM 12091]|uniref:Small nucleolar RNP protein Sm n=2 Tax=Aeropyrum camini TaxID=229980 RepID=U3T999_9CREN|nr:small nucleolar RNP protein Sm [Aeropyrum camini SY1 = JCM 12091]
MDKMATKGGKQLVNPFKYLKEHLNSQIYVKLKDGSEYVGKLVATDTTMNLILDDAIEVADNGTRLVAKIGRVLIKGSMVEFISFDASTAAEKALTGV